MLHIHGIFSSTKPHMWIPYCGHWKLRFWTLPSGKLTYPTMGKGKSSTQKCLGRGYVTSLECIHNWLAREVGNEVMKLWMVMGMKLAWGPYQLASQISSWKKPPKFSYTNVSSDLEDKKSIVNISSTSFFFKNSWWIFLVVTCNEIQDPSPPAIPPRVSYLSTP